MEKSVGVVLLNFVKKHRRYIYF